MTFETFLNFLRLLEAYILKRYRMRYFFPILLLFISSQCFYVCGQTATQLEIAMVPSLETHYTQIPYYVRIIATDSSHNIDSTYSGNCTVELIMGPNSIHGTTTISITNGIGEFTDIYFSISGIYKFKFISNSLNIVVVDSLEIKSSKRGSIAASQLYFFDDDQDSIYKDVDILKYVAAIGGNKIDTNYNNQVKISSIGTGSDSILGNTALNFVKGIAIFSNLYFTSGGDYKIVCNSNGLSADTSDIYIIDTSTTQIVSCDSSTFGNRTNLGLYGGNFNDLAFSKTTGRLFAGLETPFSVFYSDDTAHTWHAAFPEDSLEFACGNRGWGGGCKRVLTNNIGWVAAYTSESGGINSSIISFSNGDSGTWKTAADPFMLKNWGIGLSPTKNIGLSDYYMYSLLGTTIVRQNASGINLASDIIDASNGGTIQGIYVTGIAIANTSSGYPFYFVMDTTGTANPCGKLYKYDGTTFSDINLPTGFTGINNVFMIPGSVTGDTLFITLYDSSKMGKIFRSFDGCTTWTDISVKNSNALLADVEYSNLWGSWKTSALITTHGSTSFNLGVSWEGISVNGPGLHQPTSYYPNNANIVMNATSMTIRKGSNGVSGSFEKTANYGLEAIQINKIVRSEHEGMFYLATNAGLAYTTAYLDTSVDAFNKWNTPYGEFPVSTMNDTLPILSVAIDPIDSLHVIAANEQGFYVTNSGISGFQQIIPSGFSTSSSLLNMDIAFITSDTVLATTSRKANGEIWRSVDGGLSWNIVSPSNFCYGNTVAVGYGKNDTVIYVGTGRLDIITVPGFLWKSIDMGSTWSIVSAGPNSDNYDSLCIRDIAVDPRGTDTLYIAAGVQPEKAFVVSHDGGQSYSYINVLEKNGYCSAVAIDKNNPDSNVYVSVDRSLIEYNPAENKSELLLRGLPGEIMYDICIGSILVGTTTGFYTFHPAYEDKIDSTIITHQLENEQNKFSVNVYPNPFADEAIIKLTIKENASVAIDLYDLTGRKIQSIYKGRSEKGSTNYNFTANNLASGTYLINIKVNEIISRRLLYHVR